MRKLQKTLTIALTAFALTLLGVTGAVAAEQPCADAAVNAPLELAEAPNQSLNQMPAVGTDAALPAPFLAQAGEKCGNRTCPPTQYCCNDSCGICADPGEGCIQIECD